jgi:excisionase family DNA binding protein
VAAKYLNNDEAAKYLGIRPATLRGWVYKRVIPYRKHGRKVLFSVMDLDAWSEAKKVDAEPEDEHDDLLNEFE